MTAQQPPSSGGRRRFSLKTTARVAWALWAVVMVISLAAGVLLVVTRSIRPAGDPWQVGILFYVAFLSFATVGLIIAVRRPSNPLGWLLLLIGLTLSLNELLRYYADYTLTYKPGALPAGLAVGWVSTWIWAIIFPILPLVFLLFPDGRLPSHRWRPIAWVAGLSGGLVLLVVPFRAGPLEYFPAIENPVGLPELTEAVFFNLTSIYFLAFLLASASLLVRFRRAYGDERQQLKWVAYTAALFGMEALIGRWFPEVLHSILSIITIAAFAVAIAVAILKYRLYDIDRIINRTLVYGLLTALLGGVYAGLVLVLGDLFGGIGAEPPSWAVAGATLAVAALFQPARRRIQAVVDRRFNRRKYDAAKTVEGFTVRLRDEIDLDTLSTEFLTVVDQTMQPTMASLWLRSSVQASSKSRARGT